MWINIRFVRVLWRLWRSKRDLRSYCERSLEDIGLALLIHEGGRSCVA